jgi:hypothetical protein
MSNILAVLDSVTGGLKSLVSAVFNATGLTAARTFSLPDASGTLALGDQTLMLTGFESWEGTGNYYSITGSTLTLLRGAIGRIDGIEVTCAANQTVTLTQYGCTYIGFDADGVLNAVADSAANETWYRSNVVLFQGLYDGTASLVVFENHPAGTLQGSASVYAHHVFRSLIGLAPGEVNEIGADITRVTTGTGAVAGDRQIKVVGNAGLYDHGVMSMIPDSGGAAITSYFAYTDALGRWNAYAAQSEFPMVYNNAGTVTALPSGNYGINTVYVTKNEPNSGAITYITVIGTGNYANANTAETALANNQVTKATNELQRTELALLGYVVIRNSGGGHIHAVKISKQVAGAAGLGGGVGGSAALTTTDTSGFNNVLSASDSTVQLALNTLDDHAHAALYQPVDNELTTLAETGKTWTARSSAADNDWLSVTYGNGLFVAVANTGTGNRVMTSPDGVNWTARSSAADNNWFSVTYGNGLFVAVAISGTGNRVMTSPDGVNWTARSSAADNDWLSVTYGNGLFVAVAQTGTGNRVMTSPDGVNWTARSSAADNSWRSVTYGNGLFVAVANTGTGNRVMTSPDGVNWTARSSAADNSWLSVTYGNGLFVAVANTGTGNRVMTSPDGVNWTARSSAADNQWLSVTYGNGLFVAVAISGTGNRVMTSPDGVNWTARSSAADNGWRSVTYGNGLFVAVANTGTGNRVMTSGIQNMNELSHNNILQGIHTFTSDVVFNSKVSIGTTTPAASAKVDIVSTTQGFLPPRMTTAQRDAIASPATGLMIYNTTTAKINFYDGTAWRVVTSA